MNTSALLIPVDHWIARLENEYLNDFVPSGGSVVKFVSGRQEQLDAVSERLGNIANSLDYFHVKLAPGTTDENGKRPDYHRMDKFFFGATAPFDWKSSAASHLRSYLQGRGINTDGLALSALDDIAAANGRETGDLWQDIQRELATPLLRNNSLAPEFRAAMTALEKAQIAPDNVPPTTEEVLLSWLAGKTVRGGAKALKQIQIYERITQSNARYMLMSFCEWLAMSRYSGLMVVLDLQPYEHKKQTKSQHDSELLRSITDAVNHGAASDAVKAMLQSHDEEPAVCYSDPAYLNMLSLLRRFIDDIDMFNHFVLVVLTSRSFYDARSRRNYFNYDALQTRIGLEVRDSGRADPFAALVHLGE